MNKSDRCNICGTELKAVDNIFAFKDGDVVIWTCDECAAEMKILAMNHMERMFKFENR